jgi:IS4 transposase
MEDWVTNETNGSNFGDKRINERYSIVLDELGKKPEISIPASSKGLKETIGAYRFFDNEKVTLEKILEPHVNATIERMRSHPVVLLVQDTTELDYSGQKQLKGAGPLTYKDRRGFLNHPTIAITPDKLALGVICTEIWSRPWEEAKKEDRRKRPINEKESRIWIESYQRSCEIASLAEETQIINISDREGDIYELFMEYHDHPLQPKSELIVRAAQNRRLLEKEADDNKRYAKIWDKLKQAEKLGKIEFFIGKQENESKRKVVQTLRSATVILKAPERTGIKVPHLEINAVLAIEENPPEGKEAVEWLILTTLNVKTFTESVKVIEYYLCRWQIEIYFKVLKSGCKIERLQFEEADRLKRCLLIYMIIAWRILYVTMIGRSYPGISCEVVFEPEEWKAVYIVVEQEQPPKEPPKLSEMITLVASLGGYLGRKNDLPPGPKTIWVGLQRAKDFVIAMNAQKHVYNFEHK